MLTYADVCYLRVLQVRSFASVPFGSLYRGVFFDPEVAELYAGKNLPGGGGGGYGASVTPSLTGTLVV